MNLPINLVNIMASYPHPKLKDPQNKPTFTIEINGIGHLPRDLIVDILSRLPVKVLCKFRCVSKQWADLLSANKPLLDRHLQKSQKHLLLLFRKYLSDGKDDGGHYKVNMELTSVNSDGATVNRVKMSINGPIYTFLSYGPIVILGCTYSIYVINPSTQKFVPIPLCSAFRYFNVGFGYLAKLSKYMVVHLFYQHPFLGNAKMGCEIFTIINGEDPNCGSWKRIGDCPYKVRINGSSICVNGLLYWKITELASELNEESVLSLELETEEFQVISYPKFYFDYHQKAFFLTGFKGYLCLLDCSGGPSNMDIWLLKNDWIKEYSICLSGLDFNIGIKGIVPSNDENEERILMDTEQKGLVYYNIEKKSFSEIKNVHMAEGYKEPCLYYDSFFSVF